MPLFSNEGYCPICRQSAQFVASHEWMRDFYLCSRCGTCPRQRATVEVLNAVAPGWEALTIHESSPCIDFFRKQCPKYTLSYYFEDAPLGSMQNGHRCENLERLTFDDNTFDVFITQDVLEHVFRPDLAVREIARVLKPGGVHVFTAPKHKHLLRSYPRAKQHPDGSIEHLLPAEYHVSPIGDGRCLVTWDYGADFDDLLAQWSGYLVCNNVIRDRGRGIDGEYLDVFVMRKDAANQVPRRLFCEYGTMPSLGPSPGISTNPVLQARRGGPNGAPEKPNPTRVSTTRQAARAWLQNFNLLRPRLPTNWQS
jgi:SAM-dependent methyltransferase